jgi:hypothetical protein
VESADSSGAIVRFDGGGELIGLEPNAVSHVRVRAVWGGRFEVRWSYDAAGEAIAPSLFRLFHDDGSGPVEYENVIDTVAYSMGRVHYSYVSDGFGHDVRREWGVRAVSPEGVEEENTLTAFGWSDDSAPGAYPALSVERGADY